MLEDYKKGKFIRELNNRFLCEVDIDSEREICYVPSSCHLGNFLNLSNKTVLLVPTRAKNSRTQHALYAVPYKRNYIVLNTSMANKALADSISRRLFSFLGKRTIVKREIQVDGCRCVFYIEDTNTVIEVKSVISTADTAVFPTVYSERTLEQLAVFREMLKKGRKVYFFIVSLHPYVKEISIDHSTEFVCELETCINLGLQLRGYTSRLGREGLVIEREIPVTFQ